MFQTLSWVCIIAYRFLFGANFNLIYYVGVSIIFHQCIAGHYQLGCDVANYLFARDI